MLQYKAIRFRSLNKSGLWWHQPQCDIITCFIIQGVHSHSLHFSKLLSLFVQKLRNASTQQLLWKTPTDVKILIRHLSQLHTLLQSKSSGSKVAIRMVVVFILVPILCCWGLETVFSGPVCQTTLSPCSYHQPFPPVSENVTRGRLKKGKQDMIC